jgi:transposase
MFLRRKPNKTGTVSVHVITKSSGRYKLVKSFGTGRSDYELSLLEGKARQFMLEYQGLTNSLFADSEELFLEEFLSHLSNSHLQVIGPELIFGSLYDHIGFSKIRSDMFRHLVITRLFQPGSKLKTTDYLYRYQGISYNVYQIYRFLDRLCCKEKEQGEGIKAQVEAITWQHTREIMEEKIEVVFYDMTTLYFEASEEDDLRKTGFSKDGKHHCPQIFLGLLVTAGGNPIGYQIFEGNIFEGNTFIPVLQQMEKKYSLGKPVVIADSGLLSKKNIEALRKGGYQYILGARIKNETEAVKQKILALDLKDGGVSVIKKDEKTRLVLSKTDKRAAKDAHNRKRGLQRLQKQVNSGKLTKASVNNKGYNKYLKMEGEITISIDMGKFYADAAWDGIKGYITNTSLAEQKVIENYQNLFYIERAFRMNKTDLMIRPIYHRLKNRIEGHICICFTAYAIMLELERVLKKAKSDITIYQAQELTKNMYQLTCQFPKSKKIVTKILNMDQQQTELYRLVKDWVSLK